MRPIASATALATGLAALVWALAPRARAGGPRAAPWYARARRLF
ncbi:hypothetical protein [Siccirubricoccus sp. G192]|nr:hypothetical protein [Siccirubricoccus sp. G192]